MNQLRPCEKHEVTGCSYCTGVDQRFEQSVADQRVDRTQPLPKIEGGPTIYANFPGTCAGCGRWYGVDTVIHHPKSGPGWIVLDCCGGLEW